MIQNSKLSKGYTMKKHLDRTTQDKFPRGKEFYPFPM